MFESGTGKYKKSPVFGPQLNSVLKRHCNLDRRCSFISWRFVWIAVFLTIFAPSLAVESFGRCVTPDEEAATCILLDECKFLKDMIQSATVNPPLSAEDKRFLTKSQCGMYQGSVLVCCSERNMNAQSPIGTKVRINVNLPAPGICGSVKSRRIYGGNVTSFDEFPSMALIEYKEFEKNMGHYCGGSLISDRYVLTAAHCIQSVPENWTAAQVRLGEWDTTTDPDCRRDIAGNEHCADRYVEVPIQKTIVHPDYDVTSYNQWNDIALIRLSRRVAFTDFIEPICLPLKERLRDDTFEGVVMDIVGWGKTERDWMKSSKKLKAEVPVVNLEDCQRVYESNRLRRGKKVLQNTQMCAGGQLGVDSCGGDSGGPLIALDSSDSTRVYHFIAGIISYGPNPCALKGWPGVYTKVSSYIDWIQANIES